MGGVGAGVYDLFLSNSSHETKQGFAKGTQKWAVLFMVGFILSYLATVYWMPGCSTGASLTVILTPAFMLVFMVNPWSAYGDHNTKRGNSYEIFQQSEAFLNDLKESKEQD